MIWDTRKLILEQDGRLILSEDPLTLKVSHVTLCHSVLVSGHIFPVSSFYAYFYKLWSARRKYCSQVRAGVGGV